MVRESLAAGAAFLTPVAPLVNCLASSRFHRRSAALSLLLLLAMSSAWSAGCRHALRVTRASWPPYLVNHEDGQHSGMDFEILQALMNESGCRLQWVDPLPRRRRILQLQEGEIDLILAATPKNPPAAGVRYTRVYREEVLGVLALRSLQGRELPAPAARLSSFEDVLRTRTPLLVLNAGRLGPDFEPWRAPLREAGLLELFETHGKGVAMLQRQRAPLILGDVASLLDLARKQNMVLQLMPFGTVRGPVAFMLSEKSVSEADAQLLDQALGRLEARGVLREIRRRYGLD